MFAKICGITSVTDARMVAAAGANAIGLNFYPESPRFVPPAMAHEIVLSLPPFVDPVGLFVNVTIAEIRQTSQAVGLRTVQIHGDISPQTVMDLAEFSVIPAFPIHDESSVQKVIEFLMACQTAGRLPSAILVDAYSPKEFGGTGQVVPWPLARTIVQRSPVPVALAGGLTAKNVAEAIRAVRPWGVDVASGVEVAPGRKEAFKVNRFLDEVRSAVR